jgi:subtilisin-like proprotein convertase family protein
LLASVLVVVGGATPAAATSFSNSSAISIPDPNCTDPDAASPYPSTIAVSGLTGTITDVNVTLSGVTHPFEGDLEVLLVGPSGGAQNLELLSDAGTGALSNATVVFDDAAAGLAPQNSAWPAGTYKPTNYTEISGADSFPSPAPSPSGNTTLAAFNGASPNGTWSLYVTDDACPDAGSISGGWSLDITTASLAATTTTVASSLNPSTTGGNVTFTATVLSGGTPVTTGTVTFTEGATTLASNVALDSGGHAAFSTSSLAEGDHLVVATYSGDASFATSNGSVNQRVDNATTVNGNTFCNTGAIAINDNTTASPYGSLITVSGAQTNTTAVTASLKNVTHAFDGDVEALLVGPAGQNLVVVSDAGTAGVTNVTVNLDDTAASSLPQTGAWAAPNTTGSFKPTNYTEVTPDSFPAPAPAPSAATTLATFNGTDPNGAWRLYVKDDGAPDSGSIAGGWCLTITATAPPNPVTVATTPSPGVRLGGLVSDSATVSGGTSPTGTVTFKLFSDSGCSSQVFTSTNAISSGTATSDSFEPTSPGLYYWTADYNGDSDDDPASSTCGDETVNVSKAKPTLTTQASASVPVGGNITDTAFVSGGVDPSGDVRFQLYDDNTCTNLLATSVKPLAGGQATSDTYATTHPGPYYWRVKYLGDSDNAAVGGSCGKGDEQVYVTKATPTVATQASPGGPRRTTAVRDVATVTGGYNPTGQIRFRLYSDSACTNIVFTSLQTLSGGGATSADYTPTQPGTYYWSAKYLGDANNFASGGACGGANETVTIT